MMLSTLILFFWLSISSHEMQPHELLKPINWKVDESIGGGITVKSINALSDLQLLKLKTVIKYTQRDWKTYYVQNFCFQPAEYCLETCIERPLEVRIVSLRQLNDKQYFTWVDSRYTILGRYYRIATLLYVSWGIFQDSETLEHEVSHYMFDVCGFNLDTEDEDKRTEDFLKWRKERTK